MSRESLAVQARKVLNSEAIVAITGSSALLSEPGVMDFELTNLPDDGDVTVIALDKLGALGGLRPRFTLKCDFLVVFREAGRDAAVFVELKKTLADGGKTLKQLRRSPPYLAYLRTLCSIEFDCDDQPNPITICYLAIGERTTHVLPKGRVSDPQALPEETYPGITVWRFVGTRLNFDHVRGFLA